MPILDEKGRVLGRWNVLDAIMTLGAVVLVGAVLLVQSGTHRTSSAMIEGDTVIEYTVHLSHVDAQHPDNWFKEGEAVDLTVRNRPRGHVNVTQYTFTPRQAIIPSSGGQYVLAPDPNTPHMVEMYVTLRDHVLATKDGFVGNGVKLKQGSHVVLENNNTRIDGVISDLREIKTSAEARETHSIPSSSSNSHPDSSSAS